MLCDDPELFERRLAAVSVWHVPRVSVAGFAAQAGLAEGSVRQYRLTEPRFPVPVVRSQGEPSLWTLAQVYDYCASSTSTRRARGGIPRVYPLCSAMPTSCGGASRLGRARFVSAECIPAIYRYLEPPMCARQDRVPVVQYWTPGDDRGTLAVVYLAGDAELDRWAARDLAVSAVRYLHELGIASAAVVITDEEDRPIPNGGPERQRTAVVAEVADGAISLPWNAVEMPTAPGRSWRPIPPGLLADPPISVYDVGLFELRYLLRRDLPWWPVGWRDVDEIAAWKPATQRVSALVPPRRAHGSQMTASEDG